MAITGRCTLALHVQIHERQVAPVRYFAGSQADTRKEPLNEKGVLIVAVKWRKVRNTPSRSLL
jgi:hypothetical protein